jgi:hypothetical protein
VGRVHRESNTRTRQRQRQNNEETKSGEKREKTARRSGEKNGNSWNALKCVREYQFSRELDS